MWLLHVGFREDIQFVVKNPIAINYSYHDLIGRQVKEVERELAISPSVWTQERQLLQEEREERQKLVVSLHLSSLKELILAIDQLC